MEEEAAARAFVPAAVCPRAQSHRLPLPPATPTPTTDEQAGPQRSRVLAALRRDERAARLDVFPLLEKVFLERMLSRCASERLALDQIGGGFGWDEGVVGHRGRERGRGVSATRRCEAVPRKHKRMQIKPQTRMKTQTPKRQQRSDEVEAFGAALKPHQRARLPDGSTVFERAATQHNVLAASKLYRNIRVEVRRGPPLEKRRARVEGCSPGGV